MACNNQSTLFGPSTKYLKFLNGDLVAIEGSSTVDKQILNDLRIYYKQLLRSRITLKAGQKDYLLNHLGLGDNATFLSISARYDSLSKFEEDNYVEWSYATDMSRIYYLNQVLMLSGNSTHRIPQLYLTNPNLTYSVTMDIMVAVIDENYSFFNDAVNQYGYSFVNLAVTDIHTHVVSESIVVNDKNGNPLVYLRLANINSIEKVGLVLIVDDSSYGTVFLKFSTSYDAFQAHSLLNYVLENTGVNIDLLSPLTDDFAPVVYLLDKIGGTGDYIALNGLTAGAPYNTSEGITFSSSISLSTFGTVSGTSSILNDAILLDLIVASASDNRDGVIVVTASNILIDGTHSTITATGSYTLTFAVSDIANNFVPAILTLTVTD